MGTYKEVFCASKHYFKDSRDRNWKLNWMDTMLKCLLFVNWRMLMANIHVKWHKFMPKNIPGMYASMVFAHAWLLMFFIWWPTGCFVKVWVKYIAPLTRKVIQVHIHCIWFTGLYLQCLWIRFYQHNIHVCYINVIADYLS